MKQNFSHIGDILVLLVFSGKVTAVNVWWEIFL